MSLRCLHQRPLPSLHQGREDLAAVPSSPFMKELRKAAVAQGFKLDKEEGGDAQEGANVTAAAGKKKGAVRGGQAWLPDAESDVLSGPRSMAKACTSALMKEALPLLLYVLDVVRLPHTLRCHASRCCRAYHWRADRRGARWRGRLRRCSNTTCPARQGAPPR